MKVFPLMPNQYWAVENFFVQEQFEQLKSLYRENCSQFSMVYNNRLLTDYNNTPELQAVARSYAPFISNLIKEDVDAQVAYISIDLPGSKIMMHRLHTDIVAQVQVPMGSFHDCLGYSVCTDSAINQADSEDYLPINNINNLNTVTAEYYSNLANVFYNRPRAFVGMLESVPTNCIREVLVMSYQAKR